MSVKLCKTCYLEKDLASFGKRKDCKDGVNARCKQCVNQYINDYRSSHPDYVCSQRAAVRKSHAATKLRNSQTVPVS